MAASRRSNLAARAPVADAPYWSVFPEEDRPGERLGLVRRALVDSPFRFRARGGDGAELRFSIEARFGVAGLLADGVVTEAFPFVQAGRIVEGRIEAVRTSEDEGERFVSLRAGATLLCFFDVLYRTGRVDYRPGETRRVYANAFARSLRLVRDEELASDLDGEMPLRLLGHRLWLPGCRPRPDEAVFQTRVETAPELVRFGPYEFYRFAVGFGDGEAEAVRLEMIAARSLVAALGARLEAGTEIAGVGWLQGYPPDLD